MSDKQTYTVNLPKTDFPMRAGLPQQEPKWIKRWNDEDIYKKALAKDAPKGTFLLHCGPPYANGNFHVGHVLSCSLKDFVVRSKMMAGYRTPFVPGWDCHGLPIEWKVEQDLRKKGSSKDELEIPQLRDLCRKEAKQWVGAQKEDWRRVGVAADLDKPYLTMDKENEAGIVRALGDMAASGAVYKGVKSVNWSTVEGTALAEAEIEYQDHTSMAIYVVFPVVGKENDNVVIWTTTPWTIPANRAVAYSAEVEYVALTIKADDNHPPHINEHYTNKRFWVAADLVEDFARTLKITEYEISEPQLGGSFADMELNHPFMDRVVPMLAGDHVTVESGTGFVHIAPAHGAEDFELGKKAGLDLICPVAGNGDYEEFVDDDSFADGLKLAGLNIWKAQDAILTHMREKAVLLKSYKYKHSYPISWRSKAPLIFRTTPQWFLELDKSGIRQKALDSIDAIQKDGGWIPESGYKRIRGMIAGRPDWCLSRQRVWGVPITIFTDQKTGKPLMDKAAFEAVAKKIEEHGIDAWETMSTAELLEGYNYAGDIADLEKETDILDVWFDSGTTWLHVLGLRDDLQYSDRDTTTPADLYLEGSDQHRGWFHTSLLTGAAIIGRAPYKAVLTHGFVVDGNGRKMSKSVGNVIAPEKLVSQYGMDIVRLWIAASDYREDVRVSNDIIKSTTDSYRRLRNTFRYLIGNLSDFDQAKHAVAYDDLPELEKWVLSRLQTEMTEAQTAYDKYQFNRVYQGLHNFCATELSNLYFDIRKDALYCDVKNSERRRACQTVLFALLQGLTTHLAPLLPFTTDEVWHAAHGDDVESVHLQPFFAGDEAWYVPALEEKWQTIWELRHDINKAVEPLREQGLVKTNATTAITVTVSADIYKVVANIDMLELLMAAELSIDEGSTTQIDVTVTDYSKCPRCWQHTADIGTDTAQPDLCSRCAEAETTNAEVAA